MTRSKGRSGDWWSLWGAGRRDGGGVGERVDGGGSGGGGGGGEGAQLALNLEKKKKWKNGGRGSACSDSGKNKPTELLENI